MSGTSLMADQKLSPTLLSKVGIVRNLYLIDSQLLGLGGIQKQS